MALTYVNVVMRLSNNERKEVNINLYQKKKKPNLSKERLQPFVIRGKENNWNNLTTKENELRSKNNELSSQKESLQKELKSIEETNLKDYYLKI